MTLTRKIDQESAILLALFPLIALGLVNGFYFPRLAASNPGLYWVLDVFQFVVVPALCFRFLISHGVQPKDYGFRSLSMGNSWGENFALTVFVAFVFWLAYEPVRSILYRFFWESATPIPFSQALPATKPWRWLLIFYASLTAALIEEPALRSLPWLYCSRRFRSPELPYVFATSLLFGLMHWEQGVPSTIAAGFLGVVAALLYISIRNVWPFVIAHFITDMWSFGGSL